VTQKIKKCNWKKWNWIVQIKWEWEFGCNWEWYLYRKLGACW